MVLTRGDADCCGLQATRKRRQQVGICPAGVVNRKQVLHCLQCCSTPKEWVYKRTVGKKADQRR